MKFSDRLVDHIKNFSAMGQTSSTKRLNALTHSTPSLFPLPSDESDLSESAVLDVELEIVSAKVRKGYKNQI